MLTILRIKNLALVADLTLELEAGYNAITGETGAGKSILIGALNLALGERADRTLIRSGVDACAVEAPGEGARLPSVPGDGDDDGFVEPCVPEFGMTGAFLAAAAKGRDVDEGTFVEEPCVEQARWRRGHRSGRCAA